MHAFRNFIAGAVAALSGPAAICAQSPAADQQAIETAYKVWSAGSYPEAFRLFRRLADAGNPQGYHFLGHMYELGQGVSVDYKTALAYFTIAAKAGDADAQNDVGNMYASKHAPYKSDEIFGYLQEASRWYRMAADGGYPPAQYSLGKLLIYGIGAPQKQPFYLSVDEGVKYLRLASAEGVPGADSMLNVHDSDRLPAEVTYAEAMKYKGATRDDFLNRLYFLDKAAARGHAIAALGAAGNYAGGPSAFRDYGKAERLYRQALSGGAPFADYYLGKFYSDEHPGVATNYAEAFRLLSAANTRKVATVGDEQMVARAKIGLGILSLYGRGTPSNHAEAERLFRAAKALESGEHLTDASYWIAFMLENGAGRKADVVGAVAAYCGILFSRTAGFVIAPSANDLAAAAVRRLNPAATSAREACTSRNR